MEPKLTLDQAKPIRRLTRHPCRRHNATCVSLDLGSSSLPFLGVSSQNSAAFTRGGFFIIVQQTLETIMRTIVLLSVVLAGLALPALAEQPIASFSSGNVINTSAAASIPAASQQFNYLTGFEIVAGGATVGLCVNATITGALGGTMTYPYCAPAGALIFGTPLIVQFEKPGLRSAAVNTAITVTLPALGLGNTNAAVVVHGYAE